LKMATEEELKAQIDQLMQEKQDLEQNLQDAQFDSEEADKLKADAKNAREQLADAQKKLEEQEKETALSNFNQKRERILTELGVKSDDPAVELALPEGEMLDDATFDARIEKLKKIVKKEPPKEGEGEGGGGRRKDTRARCTRKAMSQVTTPIRSAKGNGRGHARRLLRPGTRAFLRRIYWEG
jgi:hypothetical protein